MHWNTGQTGTICIIINVTQLIDSCIIFCVNFWEELL